MTKRAILSLIIVLISIPNISCDFFLKGAKMKKVKAIMEANKRSSIQCDLKYGKTDLKGVSKIGGIPDVASEFTWPKWKDSACIENYLLSKIY
jgi:hypothetical protein